MPNIRIALPISSPQYHLYAEAPNRAGGTAAGNRAMTDDPSNPPRPATAASAGERKPLTPAARRALAEAEARRQAAAANAKPAPNEYNGPKGPEPQREGAGGN